MYGFPEPQPSVEQYNRIQYYVQGLYVGLAKAVSGILEIAALAKKADSKGGDGRNKGGKGGKDSKAGQRKAGRRSGP